MNRYSIRYSLTLFLFTIFSILPSTLSGQDNKRELSDITVRIKGIRTTQGNILLGLYNSKKGWLKDDKEIRGVKLEISSSTITYTFKELPPGSYAIAIFHDLNMNGELDIDSLGRPKEGFAFSNNAIGLFSSPRFNNASFNVSNIKTSNFQEILMLY